MTKLQLELWIDTDEKIISFREVAEWEQLSFETEEILLEQLDRYSSQGFRFQ